MRGGRHDIDSSFGVMSGEVDIQKPDFLLCKVFSQYKAWTSKEVHRYIRSDQ